MILYDGVEYRIEEHHGARCHIAIIDPRKASFVVTDHFATVTQACQESGAHLAINGDGWQRGTSVPSSIAYSRGKPIQPRQMEYRPWANFSREGELTFAWRDPFNLFNAVSGDRYLLQNGVFNTAIDDRTTKNARTALGQDRDGKVVLLVAEGWDYHAPDKGATPPRGLTFPELAHVLQLFGCKTAINLDGGGSSKMAIRGHEGSLALDDGVQVERSVVNHILVFLRDVSVTQDEYIVIVPVRPRETPSMYANGMENAAAGTRFVGPTTTVTEVIGGKAMTITFAQMPSGYWVPLIYAGIQYVARYTTTPVFQHDFVAPEGCVQTLHDFQSQRWSFKPRSISLNYKKDPPSNALPQTVPLLWNNWWGPRTDFFPLTAAWQWFIFELLGRANPSLTFDQLKERYRALTVNSVAFTDKHSINYGDRIGDPTKNFADYVLGVNLQNKPISWKYLTTGGNILKVTKRASTYYEFEALDVRKPPPAISDVWDKPWLIHWATEETTIKLPDGTWRVSPFPQMLPVGTPFPLFAPGGRGRISKALVRPVKGRFSPYHP